VDEATGAPNGEMAAPSLGEVGDVTGDTGETGAPAVASGDTGAGTPVADGWVGAAVPTGDTGAAATHRLAASPAFIALTRKPSTARQSTPPASHLA
jgi:hypothetical protein